MDKASRGSQQYREDEPEDELKPQGFHEVADTEDDEPEDELGDELHSLEEASNPDNTLDVEITNVEESDGEITIDVEHYDMSTDTVSLEFPKVDRMKYKFVRLVNKFGYKLSQYKQLEGETVKYHPENEKLVLDLGFKIQIKRFYSWLRSVRTELTLFVVSFFSLIFFAGNIIATVNFFDQWLFIIPSSAVNAFFIALSICGMGGAVN